MTMLAEDFMQRALDLARQAEGRTRPNPPVGAVVVRDGAIVGEGFHPRAGDPHAEIFALQAAGPLARGADLYVTLEPCSHTGRTGPCAEAVVAAGIARVFIGSGDPNPLVSGRGINHLRQAGIVVETNILADQCRRLIAPFAKHVTTGLPLVILKSALTLDGCSATVTGDSCWISGPESRAMVHHLRNRVDGIMVGIGTVLQDDPRLTCRLPDGGGRDPLRVIVDSRLQIPETAAVISPALAKGTVVATTAAAPEEKLQRLQQQGVTILFCDSREGRVDLGDLLQKLGAQGLQSLLVEGGGVLNQSLLGAGLVDRVMVFIAPKLLGGNDGRRMFSGPGVRALADAVTVRDVRVSFYGKDILIEGEVGACLPG
ncbi:bifunctional diaminohydroxyphosphoribosylaminopyrimidine deaminase/5-amino-6-(5-phosphoribosylamino)uracil reductase RibD [Desulfuromonas carbonis]|uniref:bifunctional diaminohydroxyphosphoribosylaminopyrimidine deaminase/5-amino-6-(5-phosphoribosylamino)uracil reductase RibD n=1 Tax=Desulfuromonas sp. DDH964 TaxID=1823759 RepID=UPI00078BD63B|nr:bifunctional diaminohydroxyphosphoribosylaminopyrimidine deaminase/5-amino-6-(5-phosphoribosylamino)uracil reductase RibD [Desulfuromonas sp. DDH964]AMV72183.1 2, 5-diamino-6-(5'-phosphoribosylamino)-4-(3H)-pyrimidinone deaminase and 5-amino-6-(5'-phosphoribosylamino)uracil reductase [Desulfuromonas sp. DDH964]